MMGTVKALTTSIPAIVHGDQMHCIRFLNAALSTLNQLHQFILIHIAQKYKHQQQDDQYGKHGKEYCGAITDI